MKDVAMLVFTAVMINHLGLIEAVEKIIKHEIPIVNCCKCLSFWLVLAYMLINGYSVINSVATSFLYAWAATWFELLLGVIDHYYMKIYENFYTKTTDTEDTKEKMSEVREINEEQ
jgi:uncharacterized membrane protein YkvI